MARLMRDYVYRKFPQLFDAIRASLQTDAAFRGACDDYEEICAWLAAQDHRSASPDPEQWAHARQLKRDLEKEILKLLEDQNGPIN